MTGKLTTLFDTTALVGLNSATDQHHEKAIAFSKEILGRCVTSWPVVTEADYLLAKVNGGREALRKALLGCEVEIMDLPLSFLLRHSVRLSQF